MEYNGRDVEHWKSASVDKIRTQLKHYSAVLVTSDALRDKLSELLPEVKFSVARPIFDEVRLKRQRSISQTASARSRVLRIAVLDGIALNQLIQSELSTMVRSGELDIELRRGMLESFGSIEANGGFGVNQGDFGSNLDRWCEWGADVMLIPPQSFHADNYRSAAELLFSLYMGAVPVVADVACFQDWDEQSGVYRVKNLTGAWGATLKKLSNSGERRKALARLERACSDKFSIKRHEDLLKDILQDVVPLNYFGYVERYRTLSNSYD